ncbi:nitroreductase family protein [Streptococcus macacae]|uniref:Nitroreductase family protein n=1 Tax=Streptococcus macacae NCTC 11558 TaxID=764298 RepID=G5JW63_9STRE|nr:nitroreductase family protein [Streptococcus macacae]EHJ52084.1 nitroreductase family protein [Streptococcus macacae NCTC 11558]SUN79409.1 nitroreductase family protein [Streptococcus macacae NCTC 11558]
MSNFLDLQKQRRSIYALGKKVDLSKTELTELIQNAIKQAPSAFNSQSSRAVILFGQDSVDFWNKIAYSELEKVTPKEAFEGTKAKLAGFAAGVGTILFFEDQDVIQNLEESFPLYADNFQPWSEQAHGIALYATWLALAEQHIGMNVQHYNPLVDAKLAEKYDIPANWKLRTQAPFGSIEAPAGEKEFMADQERFKVFGG